jgi:hypothetical protein
MAINEYMQQFAFPDISLRHNPGLLPGQMMIWLLQIGEIVLK